MPEVRSVLWSFELGEGHEHARVIFSATGHGEIRADGVLIHCMAGKEPVRCRYIVDADGSGATRSIYLDPLDARPPLVLITDGEGRWFDGEGRTIASLDGCVDLDLEGSCFTNTLPIRRLRLQDGETAEIKVAYASARDMSVRATVQKYTRLEATRYRYEGLESGFVAEIEVDGDQLVVAYTGLARRVSG